MKGKGRAMSAKATEEAERALTGTVFILYSFLAHLPGFSVEGSRRLKRAFSSILEGSTCHPGHPPFLDKTTTLSLCNIRFLVYPNGTHNALYARLVQQSLQA